MSNEKSAPSAQTNVATLALAWLAVTLPLAWGVAMTLNKALALFR